jgi:hypothetical protein
MTPAFTLTLTSGIVIVSVPSNSEALITVLGTVIFLESLPVTAVITTLGTVTTTEVASVV